MDQMQWIEIIIQLCRLQVQRQREELQMTPKLRGVRASMDKLRHALETDAEKLSARIEKADAKRSAVFDASHGVLTSVERDLKEVEDFVSDMEKSNGGPQLDDSEESSNVTELPPRSSEVASR